MGLQISDFTTSDSVRNRKFSLFWYRTKYRRLIQTDFTNPFILGAYRNDDLISWCLARIDGSIGALFTKAEERRLGLGHRLISEVTSKVLEYQDFVIAFVLQENVPSNNLFEKLGYRKLSYNNWIQLP